MKRTVCFGEMMGRLNPEGYLRLVQAQKLELSFAGGEANVAVSLAFMGQPSAYVTRLPRNDLGRAAMMELSRYQIDCSSIAWGGDRLGLYFVEKGASQRASKVLYDRAHSAIAEASREDFDWENIFKDAAWFHFPGITPALGGALPEICMDALKAAKKAGVTVSCDLNYRKNLWSRERAGEVTARFMPYVDLLIANEEDAADVFGIHAENTSIESGKLNIAGYVDVARKLSKRFPKASYVAITLRESISADHNNWGAMLYDRAAGRAFFAPLDAAGNYAPYEIRDIVDRFGGGDSFGAGLIHALYSEEYADPQSAIRFAAASSCLKHTIPGDYNYTSRAEVVTLMNGSGSGRVAR